MKCAWCGRDLPESVGQEKSCGRCRSGCRMIHCPACGYANPQPSKILTKLFSDKDKEKEQ